MDRRPDEDDDRRKSAAPNKAVSRVKGAAASGSICHQPERSRSCSLRVDTLTVGSSSHRACTALTMEPSAGNNEPSRATTRFRINVNRHNHQNSDLEARPLKQQYFLVRQILTASLNSMWFSLYCWG